MGTERLRYIGAFLRAHGIRGGLLFRWAPDAPTVNVKSGMRLYVGYSAQFARPYVVRSCQPVPKGLLIELQEVTTRAHAERLREHGVFVEEQHIAVEDASGWALEDILGCTVVDEGTGAVLGTVADIWLLPANDVWVVEMQTAYLPLPVIEEVVRRVDLERRRIWVRLLPGLLEIAEPKRVHEQREHAEDGIDAD